MNHSRRRYTLWVHAEVIMTLLGNWRFHQTIALPYLERCADADGKLFPLPKDVEIAAVCYEWSREAFGLMLTHPSFPEVNDGEMSPSLYYREVTVEVVPGARVKDTPEPLCVDTSSEHHGNRREML